METLVFACPDTAQTIDSGINSNPESLSVHDARFQPSDLSLDCVRRRTSEVGVDLTRATSPSAMKLVALKGNGVTVTPARPACVCHRQSSWRPLENGPNDVRRNCKGDR